MANLRAKLVRPVEMFHGIVPAGTVMDVVSLSLHASGIGICGIPASAVEFIGLDEHKPSDRRDAIPPGPEWKGDNDLPPWIGPNKKVEVCEKMADIKPKEEPAKPPSGGEHKRAAKPVAEGQLSMFDEAKVETKAPPKRMLLEDLDL